VARILCKAPKEKDVGSGFGESTAFLAAALCANVVLGYRLMPKASRQIDLDQKQFGDGYGYDQGYQLANFQGGVDAFLNPDN
jgi:hypothetical protein